jgi:putative transposase
VIDIQSVKTTESGGPRGYDEGKKIKGRKRHIVTDTESTLVYAVIHPADVQDRNGVPLALLRSSAAAPGGGTSSSSVAVLMASFARRCGKSGSGLSRLSSDPTMPRA